MFQKIMVGLDGSQHGLRAAGVGCELAKRFGSELHLVTVTRPFKVSPRLKQYLEAEQLLGEPKYVLDEMTQSIISAAKELAEKSGVPSVVSTVKEGRPARTLVDYAKRTAIDLIVLGSRGVGEVETALMGSVAHKVSMLASCAVMIVKE